MLYKSYLKYALLFIIFIVIFKSQYGLTPSEIIDKRPLPYVWKECIDIVKAGELYTGHITCVRSPIFFYIITFHTIFGKFDSLPYNLSMLFLILILQIILFFIYLKIVKKLMPDVDMFWILLFYILFVFNTKTYSFETYIACIFIGWAYYIILFSINKHKFFFSGILLAIAFFAQVISLIPAAIAIASYFFLSNNYLIFKDNKFRFNKKFNFDLIKLILGFLIVFLLVVYSHKNVLIYHLFVHINITSAVSYFFAAKAMLFHLHFRYYLLYFISLVLIYAFFKTKKDFYLVAGLSLIINTFFITKNGFLFTRTLVSGTHYILSSLFFVAISFAVLTSEIFFKRNLRFFMPFFIVILLFPGYVSSPFQSFIHESVFNEKSIEADVAKLRLEVEGVIGEIINNVNVSKIMYEYIDVNTAVDYLIARGANVSIENLESPSDSEIRESDVPDSELVDQTLAIPLKNLLKDQYEDWKSKHPLNYKNTSLNKYIDKINQDYYDIIIVGPPAWGATRLIFNDKSVQEKIEGNYCEITVPDMTYLFQGGRDLKDLLFKDRSNCLIAFDILVNYYSQRYNNICQKDQRTAEAIKNFFHHYLNLELPECNSNNDIINKLSASDVPTAEYKKLKPEINKEIVYISTTIALFLVFYLIDFILKRSEK